MQVSSFLQIYNSWGAITKITTTLEEYSVLIGVHQKGLLGEIIFKVTLYTWVWFFGTEGFVGNRNNTSKSLEAGKHMSK